MHTCRPEDNFGELFLFPPFSGSRGSSSGPQAHTTSTFPPRHSSALHLIHLFIYKTVSHLTYSLSAQLNWLASRPPGVPLSLPLRHVLWLPTFYLRLRMGLRFFMIAGQTLMTGASSWPISCQFCLLLICWTEKSE